MVKSKGQKGFTLLELVVVIILLAILAGVALPKLLGIDKEGRDAAIDGVFGAVNTALSLRIGKDKAVPAVADFGTKVISDVSLTSDLSFGTYSTGAGTFEVRSGSGTGTATGRTATATYSVTSGSPGLTLGSKSDWP